MLQPKTVAENLRSRPPEPLRVFWVRVRGDRDTFRRDLMQLRAQSPIVPWVLRKSGLFQNSNAMMSDVLEVLNEAREEIQAVWSAATRAGGADLVLLGRTELKLADTSSPILLPDWFPVAPGQTPSVRIEDLTWSARLSLSDPTLALGDLRRILHDLDHALTERLHVSLRSDHGATNSLWQRLGRKEKIKDALPRMQANLHSVSNATDYRPSVAHHLTVAGLLWGYASSNAPDNLPRTARALADALQVEDAHVEGAESPLVAVLNRPSNPIPGTRVAWAFAPDRGRARRMPAGDCCGARRRVPVVPCRVASIDLARPAVIPRRCSSSIANAAGRSMTAGRRLGDGPSWRRVEGGRPASRQRLATSAQAERTKPTVMLHVALDIVWRVVRRVECGMEMNISERKTVMITGCSIGTGRIAVTCCSTCGG